MDFRRKARGPCNLHWFELSLTSEDSFSIQFPATGHLYYLTFGPSVLSHLHRLDNIYPFPNSYISKSLYLCLQPQTCINQSGIPSWSRFYEPLLCFVSWIYFDFKYRYSVSSPFPPLVEDASNTRVTEQTLRLGSLRVSSARHKKHWAASDGGLSGCSPVTESPDLEPDSVALILALLLTFWGPLCASVSFSGKRRCDCALLWERIPSVPTSSYPPARKLFEDSDQTFFLVNPASPSTLLRAQHVVGAQELGAAGRNGPFSLKSSSSGLKSKLFKLLRVTAVQLLCVVCTPVSLLWAFQVSATLMPCVPYAPVCVLVTLSGWCAERLCWLAVSLGMSLPWKEWGVNTFLPSFLSFFLDILPHPGEQLKERVAKLKEEKWFHSDSDRREELIVFGDRICLREGLKNRS